MKTETNKGPTEINREGVAAHHSYKYILLVLSLCFLVCRPVQAQDRESPFNNGEYCRYEIKYKYGLIMMKAAYAGFLITDSRWNGQDTYRAMMDIKTTSFFDGIFETRDTLMGYVTKDGLRPLYHTRIINEGSSHYTERMTFTAFESHYSCARLVREKKGEIAVDTIHESSGYAYDMVDLFLFVRSLDYSTLKNGDTFHMSTFVGRNKTDVIIRCRGQQIVEKNKKTKYKTIKFDVDIANDAFTESKNAMEVWIADDENRIPIKLKAKLKVGAAEAFLISTKNLKHPFLAEVKL